MTSTAKSAPSRPSWTRPVCDSRMNCDWSEMMATSMTSPCCASASAKTASTASATSIVLAPERFRMLTVSDGLAVRARVAAGVHLALLDGGDLAQRHGHGDGCQGLVERLEVRQLQAEARPGVAVVRRGGRGGGGSAAGDASRSGTARRQDWARRPSRRSGCRRVCHRRVRWPPRSGTRAPRPR